jgi:hypothetical protein
MTISSTTVRNSYSGDNSTTTFSYTFKIFADSDIQVIIRSANGTETTKTITTHYTVTGAGASGGGSVIFTSGNIPTSTQTVVLRRNIPQTQAIDYIANDPFPAESHEEGLDRATMAIQQLQEEVTRSLKLSKTNTMTSTEFTVGASDRANKILAFDTNGELSVTQELGTNRGSWSAGVTFNARDIVKDSSNNNVYLCNTTHTSSGTTPISSNADSAKWDLIVDAAAASTSANAAANSAANSSNFANTSANHASNSSNHASNSSNFANNSSNSANTSATYLAGVSANANASANSASNSSNFANNSSNSANSSANHSANSSNFANNSSNHASNSSNFANNSSNSANSASTSATTATTQAGFASSNAATATTQAGFATSNATAALGYSSNSSNFANNSSNFANTASNAANAANAARDAALVAADNFDDVYLGSKTSDPTLDNDGNALTAGDLYYNSVGTVLKYYTGSAWVSITSGGITDLVQDTTPQLGGNLDINTFSIVSTSNGNINITPNGTGKVVLDGLSYPVADGSAGQALVTNGSGVLSFASAGLATQSVQTTGFTAVKGNLYPCNTTSSAFTVTLPASPSVGDQIAIVDYAGTFATNNITLAPNGNKINGSTDNRVLNTNREGVILTYVDSTQGWVATSGVNEGTVALSAAPYSIEFLVIAGGGGGGGETGGGGGAGGYRTSTQTVTVGTVITVTVGDGGAGGSTSVSPTNSNGSNSSISGSGLTTITSTGGGGGGTDNAPFDIGASGGSGGGASGSGANTSPTGGSGNTPSTSPSQGNNGGAGANRNSPVVSEMGGGGGGASASGANGVTSTSGGNGGAGTASSITGSSVTRAGGGGGGAGLTSATAGSGGAGGGASGTNTTATPPNATANTGGGGGGSGGNAVSPGGSAGGKGVVILSMPDASYSGTTTGSPTVTPNANSTGKTVIQFNGSGSYTA